MSAVHLYTVYIYTYTLISHVTYYNCFYCFSLFLSSYPCLMTHSHSLPLLSLSLSLSSTTFLYYCFHSSSSLIIFNLLLILLTSTHTHKEQYHTHTHTHTLYTYSSLLVITVNIPRSIRTDHNYLLKHLSLCVRDSPTRQIYIYI